MIFAQRTGLQSVKQDRETFRFYKLYRHTFVVPYSSLVRTSRPGVDEMQIGASGFQAPARVIMRQSAERAIYCRRLTLLPSLRPARFRAALRRSHAASRPRLNARVAYRAARRYSAHEYVSNGPSGLSSCHRGRYKSNRCCRLHYTAQQLVMLPPPVGNESAPIQLAQCRFPGLAISNAKM